MPLGAPSFDRWGGDRKGANLFGNSIVAVEATTGKYLWHFQTVHHDIWDLDLPAATLVDVKRNGKNIPAIAVMNKTALLFLLDRVTGLQCELIAHWLGVGFIHRVMNTDNVAISGETID